MASVSSLDQDMRRLRMQKAKDPAAVSETTKWIEDTLGQKLPPGDLMDVLKDGTILCQLAGLAVPGIKFKKSAMPFMQMENISHFLKACEQPPISLPAHDRFLTVDLFEKKDPAQVLQCLGSFSRAAHALDPSKFPTCIGPKMGGSGSIPSPSATGNGSLSPGLSGRSRGLSNSSNGGTSGNRPPPLRALSPALTGGSNSSRTSNGTKSPGPVSSWSKRTDERVTSPAWNIAQYGYMGGANQGSQGVAFGARRQITTAAPHIPNAAEKERKRKEQEAEAERKRVQAEEADAQRRAEREAEEQRARAEEERRWEEETRRQREEEKRKVEQQKREWEEQERKWKADEEARLREEREAEEKLEKETQRKRATSDARLRGQFLSQYQAEQNVKPRSRQVSRNDPEREAERERIAQLERQLAEAKEREKEYQREREERIHGSRPSTARPPSPPESNVSWAGDEREYLRQQWNEHNNDRAAPALPSRPLPDPAVVSPPPTSPRPLPNPSDYVSAKSPVSPPPPSSNRTDRFLASNPAPFSPPPKKHSAASEIGFTSAAERAAEDARRVAAQQKTKAGGWASKSLLEREMERERQRQKEWEESQKKIKESPRDETAGSKPGASWDVNQYGYTGGDSQNKVGTGIGFGGRRQIIGPRPRP